MIRNDGFQNDNREKGSLNNNYLCYLYIYTHMYIYMCVLVPPFHISYRITTAS